MLEQAEFIDGESGRVGFSDKVSFRNIVMNTVMRLGFYFAVEFRGGYWEDSGQGRRYLPNTRQVVENEIEYLWILLEPHFNDETIAEEKKAYEEALKWMREKTPKGAAEPEAKVWENEAFLRYSKRRLRIISRWLKENSYLEGANGVDEL